MKKKLIITEDHKKQIIQLRNENKTIRQIAKIIGSAFETIRKQAIQLGVNERTNSIKKQSNIILQLHSDGKTIKQIATETGLHWATISKFFKAKDIQKKGLFYTLGLTKEQEELVEKYIWEGLSDEEISDISNINIDNIKLFTKMTGVRNKITVDIAIKIKSFIECGMNYKQISEAININAEPVRQFCIDNDLKVKQKILTEQEQINLTICKDLREKFSKALHKTLRRTNEENVDRFVSFSDHLPYNIRQLKEHIENQFETWMTWDNWGVYCPETWNDNNTKTWVWQLDHIRPLSLFIYTSMKDKSFQECWALSNLRPLSAKQNIIDGVTRVRHLAI